MNAKHNLLLAAAILLGSSLAAQNPIIKGNYTADPTARVFGDRVYLYPSHDIISPTQPEAKWFSMADYHVYSSENLVDWTDHGVILSQEQVPWGNPEGYSMWAPDCVERDGKYYFYFPDMPAEGGLRGFTVGVAVADSPEGPYEPLPTPIKGINGIDPCVLQASDGDAYIYWANNGMLYGARLKDNMCELDGKTIIVSEGLPEGFKEGPFVFEKDGTYYLTYPWVQDATETLAYATSKNPRGPFDFKGLIMEQSPTSCWTNHHSLVQFKGQWYLFYHHNDYSPAFDKNRSARIDKLIFNADGSIQPVTPTLRGVGISDARKEIQMDRYSQIYPYGTSIAFLNPASPFDGWYVRLGIEGAWVRYDEVDFSETAPTTAILRVRAEKASTLAISASWLDVFGEVKVPKTAKWKEVKVALSGNPTGLKNLVLSLTSGSGVEIDWIRFE